MTQINRNMQIPKTIRDDYKLKSENFFRTNVSNLRGHSKKLFKPQSNIVIDHHIYFYIQIVVEPWNKVPETVHMYTLSSFHIESHTNR